MSSRLFMNMGRSNLRTRLAIDSLKTKFIERPNEARRHLAKRSAKHGRASTLVPFTDFCHTSDFVLFTGSIL